MIVVFFLILNHLYGDLLACFVIFALENLTKSAFADELHEFESVTDLVATDNAIIAFTVIEAIINQAL